MTGCWTPSRRYRQTLVAAVKEPQHVAAEDVTDVLHSADAGAVRLHRPVSHMEGRIDHRQVVFLRRVLEQKEFEDIFTAESPSGYYYSCLHVKSLPSIARSRRTPK